MSIFSPISTARVGAYGDRPASSRTATGAKFTVSVVVTKSKQIMSRSCEFSE